MEYAFPFDELKPITCIGRGRDRADPSNTGLNDVLGDYLLTLVDTLDTLAVLGDKEEFDRAVKNVLTYLKDFDIDSHVQVFEVTIRMLGGLLSAHIIATDEEDTLGMRLDVNGTYNGELLRLARDLGYRLLPAFEESPNGTPYARTNLKHGLPKGETSGTCAAGVGTLLLEFGTLSRLTNETIFENVARLALNEMWTTRSKKNLFGNAYDLSMRKWMHPISGTGAGVDSIYEYLLKSYVYFGDHRYLRAFDVTYSALLQYSRDTTAGYAFYNVHMQSAEISSFWIDALSAFFPGMMVLAGDVDGAESAYMLYYHIWRRFHAIPERFNLYLREPDISYYLLRPEFIESTYYLYRATMDPFYLDVGEMILTDLNTLMRTSCGYTSIHDVRSHSLEERMDSFVLSETLKYLYLLFDDNNPLHKLDNNHVFTTEGHTTKKYKAFDAQG
ncbi:glycoside hydrolase [Coemansia reversa NRRL 1564]|uniref:alpha-1,2-Mannosidase n=1 Tax=Coemansia reversa (strain ATCC 12441 / NRRL 1564) TaxID=763665 RepID=A0A2G5BI84_COERN|nr:glycoside hydrolase [Coemansia reversa NRRL 1564]|eukprot:PIA18703.1 glycoside hydrolase [Coemansia reversa NRRL 1564]